MTPDIIARAERVLARPGCLNMVDGDDYRSGGAMGYPLTLRRAPPRTGGQGQWLTFMKDTPTLDKPKSQSRRRDSARATGN